MVTNSFTPATANTTPRITPIVVIDDSSKRRTISAMMNHRTPVTRKTHQRPVTSRAASRSDIVVMTNLLGRTARP
jgi:hypothetical protein